MLTLSIALAVLAQDAKRPILTSHDRVDGPMGGEYQVSDLRIFDDGRVVYLEEGTKSMGEKPIQATYRSTLPPATMRSLAELLESRDIRSLPKRVSSKTRPIDFFWKKSVEIDRLGKIQKIEVENFYPFLNLDRPVYPKALIELECRLQGIETEVAKRSRPKDEDDWCKDMLDGKHETSVEPSKADCREDEAQPAIVAGEGWGPVRIGAAWKAVTDVLGDGQAGSKYSDVYFMDYPQKGIQVSFENTSNTVHAIYFYNGQRGNEQNGTFCGRTSAGVNWRSSVDEVKKAYGQPTGEFAGSDSRGSWQRVVFSGIDFRFENGKMVRVGIPGR